MIGRWVAFGDSRGACGRAGRGRSDRTVHAEACAAVLSGAAELCACVASTDVTRALVEGAAAAATEAASRVVALRPAPADPRDVMIICLAQACGILKELLSGQELVRALPRIAQVRRMDLIGQALTRTIEHVESAITFSLGRAR